MCRDHKNYSAACAAKEDIMAKRIIGDYPVIGIRPTIDGRRGALKVRESLEEQTMNMARAAKQAFRGESALHRRRARKGSNC